MIEQTLFETIDLVDIAIKRLKSFCPSEGYYLAFSGGKDSIVCKELLNMSGCKYDAHYNLTTIDPPELVKFIKEFHSDVVWERPKKAFLKALLSRGFPQRQRRWCCSYLKEGGGAGRRVVTGVRWAESYKRAKRKTVEHCLKDERKIYIHPIIEWTDDNVWTFIRDRKIPYCKLYDEGWKRIGCLFCPSAGKHRLLEVEKYPKFKRAFIKAFHKLYLKKKSEGNTSVDRWKNGEDMFTWWITENRTSEIPDQGVMFE
jgi:phosphoadenosine phosphosulfate reductase